MPENVVVNFKVDDRVKFKHQGDILHAKITDLSEIHTGFVHLKVDGWASTHWLHMRELTPEKSPIMY